MAPGTGGRELATTPRCSRGGCPNVGLRRRQRGSKARWERAPRPQLWVQSEAEVRTPEL